PRIITPSSTAWPPTGASRLATGIPSGIRASARRGCPSSAGTASTDGGLWTRSVTVYSFGSAKASLSFPAPLAAPPGGLALAPRRATLEALNPATCVEKLLLARVERMARRADLDVQLRLRGARVELVPARAANVGEHVLGVDPGLHASDVSGAPVRRHQPSGEPPDRCAGRRASPGGPGPSARGPRRRPRPGPHRAPPPRGCRGSRGRAARPVAAP